MFYQIYFVQHYTSRKNGRMYQYETDVPADR
jgi:hypothetical protein